MISVPAIVAQRWREAHARPSIGRWHSLGDMLAGMVAVAGRHASHAPVVDDLRTLAEVARQHQIDLQPVYEQEAA